MRKKTSRALLVCVSPSNPKKPTEWKAVFGEIGTTAEIEFPIDNYQGSEMLLHLYAAQDMEDQTCGLATRILADFGYAPIGLVIYHPDKNADFGGLIAMLIFSNEKGAEKEYPLAYAQALLFAAKENYPIFIQKSLFKKLGYLAERDPLPDPDAPAIETVAETNEEKYEDMEIPKLQDLLTEALSVEKFERAAKIRDVLKDKGVAT